jgi:hypothetical protein
LYFVKEPGWQLEILPFMMKFRFFLLSFFFFSGLTTFAEENKDKTGADTLKIVPAADTVNPGDSILVAPADTNAVQTRVDSSIDSVERKGFLALWVMIAILILLAFVGYRYRHKDK